MQGTRVGPYTLLAELGSGGMGTVWRAEGPAGVVALKVVHAHLVEQPGFRERFLREAKAGRSIASPNVVRTIECLDAEVEGKLVPALVLEFVEGRDLAALLDETKRVPEDLCRYLGREIARGLDAIHAAGIVHRDMKPGNVLLTSAGDVKVMDLGLARQASGEDRMSQTGVFLGTAVYAPPEQFLGKKDLDPRSDLYSLGAMLFELATGRLPFEAEGIGDLVRKVLRDRAPRIGALAPQVTPFLEQVVATLLEKEPDRRFASAAELGEVLEAGEAGDWWAAASARIQAESRRPLRRVRVQRETELWGRDDDLAELRGLWDMAKKGRGAVVLLEGEAGIGKTRLVEELLAVIETEDDAQILVGRHDPAGAGSAPEALAAAFRVHLGTDDLEARLRDLLPETPILVPAFAALLRGEAAPEGAMALTPDPLRVLFVRLARNLAKEAPLVLVVDDLHFASDEGRALFRAVALAAEEHAILLVGTARPGLPAKWVDELAGRENVTRHEMKRLDEDTVRAALATHLGGGWEAESVAEKIASQAGGNPYFVVEVLRHLGEQGNLARTADGTWRVSSVPADFALPATVRELVANRLAALAPADREILEAASCQGHEFDGRLAAETLGRPRMDALRALGRLEQATRLVRAAGARFTFDHHVVHEVLYDGQTEAAKVRNHRGIGDALEARHAAAAREPNDVGGELCASLTAHLLRGGAAARAARYLDTGLVHLERTYRTDEAISVLDLALAADPGAIATPRGTLLLALARRLDLLGRRDAQRATLDEAIRHAETAGDEGLRADARAALGVLLLRTGRYDAAREALTESLAFAERTGSRWREAQYVGNLGNVAHLSGRPEEAEALHARRLALARERGDRQGESHATGNLGVVARSRGRLDDADAHFRRHLALAREIGDLWGESVASGNLGSLLVVRGRVDEGIALVERSLELARRIANRQDEVRAAGKLGDILLAHRSPAEARPWFERELALAREAGDAGLQCGALRGIGGTLARSGRTLEAAEWFARSLAEAEAIGSPSQIASATGDLGTVLADLGRFADAERHYERSLALKRQLGAEAGVTVDLVNIAAVRHALGDPEAARRFAEESLQAGRRIGARDGDGHALLVLAAAADELGDAAGAESFSAEAVAAFREGSDGAMLADALIEHGAACARAGGAERARCLLAEAVGLASSQGRPAAVALARALLAGLPGGDAAAAVAAIREAGATADTPRTRLVVWQATRDRAHLVEAKRLLDGLLAKNPPEYHEGMETRVRVNREILEACAAEGIG